jgi:hypothetical protein
VRERAVRLFIEEGKRSGRCKKETLHTSQTHLVFFISPVLREAAFPVVPSTRRRHQNGEKKGEEGGCARVGARTTPHCL